MNVLIWAKKLTALFTLTLLGFMGGCEGELPPTPSALGFTATGSSQLLATQELAIEPARSTSIVRDWVYRGEVLAVAEAYRLHRWTPTQANVFHGFDAQGVRVDTPDVNLREPGGYWRVGRETQGVPYRWGGFESLDEFDRGLAKGLAAGDIYSQQKRTGLEAQVSNQAVGIDCSGMISRAWRLPKACSTRTLPSLCTQLGSYDEMREGDIFNIHNHHVMLFVRWVGKNKEFAEIMEVGARPFWSVHRHAIPRDFMQEKGYKAYRYKRIRENPADGSKPWL